MRNHFYGVMILISVVAQYVFAEKRAIVIGASSGMGRQIAKLLSNDGYTVGIAARRIELLESLRSELSGPSYIQQLDVTSSIAREELAQLIDAMGGVDLVIISISNTYERFMAGQSDQRSTSWIRKAKTIDVCAKGFIAMADVVLEYFQRKGSGHLVGISSTSGLRGNAQYPEYCAAKACISRYLESVRNYMIQKKYPILITDVVPGYVAVEYSPLGTDPEAYWEISAEDAAREIVSGIKAHKQVVYVPPRIRLVAALLTYLPDWIYNKFMYWL